MTDNHHHILLSGLARTGDTAAFCSLFNVPMIEVFTELTTGGLSPAEALNAALPVYRNAYKRFATGVSDPLLLKEDWAAWHSRYVSDVVKVNVPNQSTGLADATGALIKSAAAETFCRAIKKGLMQEQAVMRKKTGGNRIVLSLLTAPVPVGWILVPVFVLLILTALGVGIFRLHLSNAGFTGALVVEGKKDRHVVRLFGQLPLDTFRVKGVSGVVTADTLAALPAAVEQTPALVSEPVLKNTAAGKVSVVPLAGKKITGSVVDQTVRKKTAPAVVSESTGHSDQETAPVNESPLQSSSDTALDSALKQN